MQIPNTQAIVNVEADVMEGTTLSLQGKDKHKLSDLATT